MSDRMDAALDLAQKCWSKAYRKEPHFVESYLINAEKLLVSKPVVLGDEFRDFCGNHLLFLPATLHHNTWVSGVRALQMIGWIDPITKVEPVKTHNHMDTVTMWRSNLYDGRPLPKPPQMELSF
jgi:hypothetical protein